MLIILIHNEINIMVKYPCFVGLKLIGLIPMFCWIETRDQAQEKAWMSKILEQNMKLDFN